MKIVNRKEFLKLPANTLYAKYEPCNFWDLAIKGYSIVYSDGTGNDWYYMEIEDLNTNESHSSDDYHEILSTMVDTGKSYSNDYCTWSRDGLYDDDDGLFAIWEKEDLVNLIELLNKCK